MLAIDEYLKLREAPKRRHAMYQSWRDLSFLHFAIEPDEIRPLVPKQLELDLYPDETGEEKAWVGLVPFWMTGIRNRGLPRVPGAHTFPETNVRTYVHLDGKEPAVWFFSLDAANRLACLWARTFFGLNYHWASMLATQNGGLRSYTSARVANPDERCAVTTVVEDPTEAPEPGSLEFFLVERYLLYAIKRGVLFKGQVNHPPYPLRSATVETIDETLVETAGIPKRPYCHVLFSAGVDVRVFPLQLA